MEPIDSQRVLKFDRRQQRADLRGALEPIDSQRVLKYVDACDYLDACAPWSPSTRGEC